MHIKHLFLSAIIVAVLFIAPQFSSAQFVNGHIYLGPHLTFVEGAGGSLVLGANLEVPLTQPGSAGPGMFALAPRVDFLFATGGPYVGAAILANYHFKLDDAKWDPYLGVGASFIFSPFTGYVAFNAGGRYFLNSSMALRALVGTMWSGFMFTIGLDWTI